MNSVKAVHLKVLFDEQWLLLPEAETIRELFEGDITTFLAEGQLISS